MSVNNQPNFNAGIPQSAPSGGAGQMEIPANSILNNRDVMTRMEAYCKKTEAGLPFGQVQGRVLKGEEVARQIAEGKSSGSKEDVKNLTWFMMAQAARYGEEHVSGAFRIDDSDGQLIDFLQNSLRAEGSYGRISSHMKEHAAAQFGCDFKKGELPGGMRTLLFTHLSQGQDKTTYLKFESRGCPPFWKKGFRSYKNFREYASHAMDFIHTRVRPAPGRGYAHRKEHVPKEVKAKFTAAMLPPVAEAKKRGIAKRIFGKKGESPIPIDLEVTKAIEEGSRFGISRMDQKVRERLKNGSLPDDQRQKLEDLHSELSRELNTLRARGYTGEVKGREVVLPSVGEMV